MSAKRLSGLQKDVISLYREILREAIKKDRNHAVNPSRNRFLNLLNRQESSVSYARLEFRKQSGSIKRSDFRTIEYSIRKGRKHLQLLKMPGVKVVGGST